MFWPSVARYGLVLMLDGERGVESGRRFRNSDFRSSQSMRLAASLVETIFSHVGASAKAMRICRPGTGRR